MSDRLLDVEGALVDQHAVPVQFHGPLTARNGGVHLVDHVKGGVAEKIPVSSAVIAAEVIIRVELDLGESVRGNDGNLGEKVSGVGQVGILLP